MEKDDAKTILKCPRATCHHRQKLPWETSDSPLQDMVSMSEEVTRSCVISRKSRRKAERENDSSSNLFSVQKDTTSENPCPKYSCMVFFSLSLKITD